MTIVRHAENTKRHEEREEPLPYIPEKSVRQKLQVGYFTHNVSLSSVLNAIPLNIIGRVGLQKLIRGGVALRIQNITRRKKNRCLISQRNLSGRNYRSGRGYYLRSRDWWSACFMFHPKVVTTFMENGSVETNSVPLC